MFARTLFITTLLTLPACGQATPTPDAPQATPGPVETSQAVEVITSQTEIVGTEGSIIGNAKITGGPHGVLIRIEIAPGGLAPGWHGLHLHQVGDCSDTGVFKKSGGHVGKVEGGHGLLNAAGPEGGDIPNIYAHTDGSAGYEALSTFATLGDLFDEDGAAIIIHESQDDHLTQPIGGAGPRVACGVIE